MKISITEQIHEAETHRDELQAALARRPELTGRLHRSEGIVLTLRLIESVEAPFRQFMATRHSKDEAA